MSGIGKQAKIPSEHQIQALLAWLETRKHADRNRLIVLLSYKAGLRAKEIASLHGGRRHGVRKKIRRCPGCREGQCNGADYSLSSAERNVSFGKVRSVTSWLTRLGKK